MLRESVTVRTAPRTRTKASCVCYAVTLQKIHCRSLHLGQCDCKHIGVLVLSSWFLFVYNETSAPQLYFSSVESRDTEIRRWCKRSKSLMLYERSLLNMLKFRVSCIYILWKNTSYITLCSFGASLRFPACYVSWFVSPIFLCWNRTIRLRWNRPNVCFDLHVSVSRGQAQGLVTVVVYSQATWVNHEAQEWK